MSVFSVRAFIPNCSGSPLPFGPKTKLQPKPPTRLPEAELVQFPLSDGAAPPAKSEAAGAVSTATNGSSVHHLATPVTGSFSPGAAVVGAGNAAELGGVQHSVEDTGHSVELCSEPWPRWEGRALRLRAARHCSIDFFFFSRIGRPSPRRSARAVQ